MQEDKRVARVLDIIWRINQAPHHWTRRRLAEVFEVSERTITSDLELIRHRLRFEIQNDRGRGYYFSNVHRLPSVSYSVPEALALILAAQVGRQFTGIPQHDLSVAIARLTSVIPAELRSMVERLVSDMQTGDHSHREQILAQCSRAIASQTSVDIVYEAASRGGQVSERRIDPYFVFPYVRSWHVVGHCHLRDDIRIFKVDRIQSVAETGDEFEPRPDFDLGEFLTEGWGIMRGLDAPAEDVTLRFKPPSSRWVAEERWHGTQQVELCDDGSILFRVRIQITPEFQRWVFRYGRDVEVIRPVHLRDWVAEEALAMLDSARQHIAG